MLNNKIFDAIEYKTVKDVIYNSAKKYENNIAFTIKNKNKKDINYKDITYKQLIEDINKLGTGLYNLGFKHKRIAIVGKNRYEWILAHLTNLFGGIISIPLDKDLQIDELENSLVRSKADVVIFDSKLLDFIKEIEKNNKTNISKFISMDENINDYESVYEIMKNGDKLLKKGNRDFIDVKIDENAMNVLLFTSGTTSQSKAVMLSQRNIASNIYALQCAEDIRQTDTNIAFLPFHHIFGSTCILFMLAQGVRTVFPDGLRYIKQNLNEYKVTVFVGVPVLIEAIYKTIMKELDKQGKRKLIENLMKLTNILLKVKIDIRRKVYKPIIDALGGKLRLIVSGGAPADAKVAKNFNSLGINVVQGYGLTETSPVIAAENVKFLKTGSVGRPMVDNEVEIVEKDANGIGEIKVKGPNVMIGYYEMPEITKEVLKDGWFYTGDLGYIDKDGYLYITGRSKNMIVLKNGKKVFPEELETLINRLELVEESMVFGLPNKKDKNDVKLSVKVVYNKEIADEKYSGKNEDELYQIIWNQIKEINTTFPKYKHIQNMILTNEELIKTTTKKVKRQEEIKKIISN